MTPLQMTLIRQTSDVLLSVKCNVAEEFYRRLFELAPEAQRFFAATDMWSQKQKLTNMLASLIGALGRPDVFESILLRAGQDHARLGIERWHYEPARLALIDALALTLGPRFTVDVRDAWTALYSAVEERMLAAGR